MHCTLYTCKGIVKHFIYKHLNYNFYIMIFSSGNAVVFFLINRKLAINIIIEIQIVLVYITKLF